MNKQEQPIRVAQIIGKWLGGGVEAVVMNYYRHIDRTKIQFDFICDEDSTDIPKEEIESYGGKVILVPPYQKAFKYHKELKRVLKEGNYKIVHSHINTLSVFSLFAAKCAGVPTRIAHSHSTTNKKEKKKNLLKQVLRPFSKLFATDYMCCSELAGRWLFGNKEYDKGNVYLLNNAIDLDKFKYDEKVRKEKRKELNISDDTLVIGHVGRFVEQKNHRFLIDIFNEVHKQKENSILLLAGQGPLMEEMKEKVKTLGIENSVIFLGQRNDINKLYQAFDVFCLPSLYEGLPVVGVEAQATGLLCMLSDDMTKETKVLDSTIFIRLNNTAEEWARELLNNFEKFERKDTKKEISCNNFDIRREVNKLTNKYFGLKVDNCYSFDIFNTLIKRFVDEKQFFDLIEKKLNKININIRDFSNKRSEAEHELNKMNKNYTINDIYQRIEDLSEKDKKIAIKIEKEYLESNMIPNKIGLANFTNICGKKICVSDMYLDGTYLKNILKTNGFDNIENIYVSCDYNGDSKKNKRLYNIVKKKYHINTHYGDAIRSDYFNAKSSGIKSKKINNKRKRYLFDYNCGNYYFNIGVNVFGPMIYEFNNWLRDEICKRSNVNVLFLTREGYYLQKSFSKQYNIKNELFYISRKSVIIGTCLAFINKYSYEEFMNYFDINKEIKLEKFLKKIGCDNEIVLNKYKENLNTPVNNNSYLNLKKDKDFIGILKKNNLNFEKYITNVIGNDNLLIDVGWNGTMQKYLTDYFKVKRLNVKFYGLYLGCMNEENKKGYLFSYKDEVYDKIMCFSGLLENVFMPSFGTTTGYDVNGEPLFRKTEFSKDSQKIIKDMQDGMDFFVDKMNEFENLLRINKEDIINNLYKLGIFPSKKDINYFEKIELLDGERVNNLIDGGKGRLISKFIDSKWKTAFIKKRVYLNLDYSDLISMMRKLRK